MIRVPGYILTKKLGVGGMATVYLALQTSLQRQVALKVMAPAFAADRSFANRFVTEARTIAELNHPNIVAIHDVGVTEEGLHYFAMQYLPNGDFQSRIDAGIRERELIRVLLGICSALEHAHERGFVHRDVTPGNVLFDNTGMPVLTDFGIARLVTEATRMTATGLSLGTSHYMSPEQARGRRVDFRSDLYSLGAVTYEALVGQPPYDGDDSFAVAYAHVYEPLPEVPARLARWQAFIDRAMAKDPADRFQSAAEVREVLHRYLDKTSRDGRQTSDARARAMADAATVPLRIRDAERRRSRVRWLKLALGRHPRDWLTGLGPALSWSLAWLRDAVSRALPRRWLAGGLAVIAAVAIAWLLWPAPSPVPADPEPVAIATISEPPPVADPVAEPPATDGPEAAPAPADGSDAGAEPAPGGTQLAEIDSFEPDDPALVDIENGEVIKGPEPGDDAATRPFRERIQNLIAEANQDLNEDRLTTPEDENALDKFEEVLSLDGANIQARDGLERIVLRYVALARGEIRNGRYDLARLYQQRGTQVARRHGLADRFDADLASIDALGFEVTTEIGRGAEERGNVDAALEAYREALRFRPDDARIAAALDRLANPEPPGPVLLTDALSDGAQGPEMVVLEVGGREVAVGTTEVTLDLFRKYMSASDRGRERRPACRHLESRWRASRKRTWEDPGFAQSGRHPVVCVSWRDAAGFAAWLSAETSQRYRLPSGSEWRALAAVANAASDCRANVGDAALAREVSRRELLDCDDGWSYTAPVGSFAGTETGLFDTVGNVREWIQDCTKSGRNGECRERGVMGSAWMDGAGDDLLAASDSFDEDHAYTTVGFRLIREM